MRLWPSSLQQHPAPELLLAYRDGELPPADGGKVGSHLTRCAPCRTRLEGLQADLDRYVDDLNGLSTAAPASDPETLLQAARSRTQRTDIPLGPRLQAVVRCFLGDLAAEELKDASPAEIESRLAALLGLEAAQALMDRALDEEPRE